MSREWLTLLIRRMDAVASVYRLAASLSPGIDGLRSHVEFHRRGRFDATITLHDGRSFGVVRQGLALRRRSLYDRLREAVGEDVDSSAVVCTLSRNWDSSSRRTPTQPLPQIRPGQPSAAVHRRLFPECPRHLIPGEAGVLPGHPGKRPLSLSGIGRLRTAQRLLSTGG